MRVVIAFVVAMVLCILPVIAMTVNPDNSVTIKDKEARVLVKKMEDLQKENEDQFFYILELQGKLKKCNSKVGI